MNKRDIQRANAENFIFASNKILDFNFNRNIAQ